ncbi:hypothetical protein [Paraburkholderia lacunae]|uniref:hypothetical protein n=1 Tax=Paraburkholderia lacunae TaxID=2211104 RepID=UPI0014026D64|nr:hypothetical protein [Paraburkholderia lacunae]
MSEAVAIVAGSFVLVTATAFVAVHYHRELMRRRRLRELDYRQYWWDWGSARR